MVFIGLILGVAIGIILSVMCIKQVDIEENDSF